MIAAMPSFSTKPPTSDTPVMVSELSDTGNVTRSPHGCLSRLRRWKDNGRRYSWKPRASTSVAAVVSAAIGEKNGIQALVLRRGRQCREEQER